MARYIDPKCRLCRREGIKLFLKGARCYSPKCPIDRRGAVVPGFHGTRSKRKMSDYGIQLREKQKAKRTYGVLERQFAKYYREAERVPGATGEQLLSILETRLDNIIYRLGLTPSRSIARQLVSHGHILLNNKKNNFPSTIVKMNDVISLDNKAMKNDLVKKCLEEKNPNIPDWLERKAAVGRIKSIPKREDIDTDINEQLIVEFYSR